MAETTELDELKQLFGMLVKCDSKYCLNVDPSLFLRLESLMVARGEEI